MARLRITLLGPFAVSSGSRRLELNSSAAHLLAYLALSGGRLIPRTRIAGSLWPDLPEIRARANLSTSVWRLRQALSRHEVKADVVRTSEYAIGIDADLCEVDVDGFRHDSLAPGGSANTLDTLARAAYATGLYRGDLLEDWDLEWCRLEREQLRQRFAHTLRALAEGFERLGRYDLALQYARRAADAEPSDEPAQRTLIRLLMRTGDRGSAARQFHRFAGYVRSELGVEPDSQTMALYGQAKEVSSDRWLDQAAEPRVPLIRPGMIPLVGRTEEHEQINGLLDAAMSGVGGSVLVLGEAGIGKSKLAEWAIEEWAARGGLTARGRCIEFNDPIPYQPVLDAISSVADVTGITGFATQSAGALPSPFEEAGFGSASERRKPDGPWPAGKLRLFGWLLKRLDKVSRRRPLLIVIEDLQWADPSSVDFLAYLLERARSMRLLVLVTARPSGRTTGQPVDIERLSRYSATTLRLRPLTSTETAELVQVLLDGPPVNTDLARSIYAETEGNPLFVIETIRLFQQRAGISVSTPLALSGTDDPYQPAPSRRIPAGVRSAVEQRLALIDTGALRVARIASVLGRGFDEELLSMVAGTGANRLSRAIGRLLRAEIFEREDAGYRFAHDKIRAVCYESLPVRVRRIYHAQAAAALSQIPDLPVHRLAWHQHSAGQWSLAAASWEMAGDHAITIHAYEEALRAYQYAIVCVQRDGEVPPETANRRAIRVLLSSEKALAVLGRPSDRRKILERIDVLFGAGSETTFRAEWLVRRALLEDYIGDSTLAATLARRAWSIARTEGNQHLEIEALHVIAYALYRVERFTRSLAVLKLVLRRARERSPSAVTALMHLAVVYSVFGDFVSASASIEKAGRTSIELGLKADYYQVISRQAVVDKFVGNVRQSRLRFSEALRLAREANDPVVAARVTLQIAIVDALEGRLGDAVRGLRAGMVACRAVGYMRAQAIGLNEVAYSVARLLGNYTWAWDASAHALNLPVTIESDYLSWMCKDSQAMLLLEQGRLQEAMGLINECLALVEPMRTTIAPSHAFLESLARRGVIWLQLGNPDKAAADLEEARKTQAKLGHRLLLVDTLTYLAVTYASLGDAERALLTSNDALSLLAEIGYANHQPQRVFWHHYLILEKFNRKPRLPYLKRAVEFIEAQAATVSKAQARRFKRDVRLNREILEAWERHRQALESTVDEMSVLAQPPIVPASVVPAT